MSGTAAAPITAAPLVVLAAIKVESNAPVELGLDHLLARNEAAGALAGKATAVVVVPDIVKGGLIVGGQYGEGAPVKHGKPVAYYNTMAASYGLQIGVQTFGQALFLMNERALAHLDDSEYREIVVGRPITSLHAGKAADFGTTTAKDDI